MNVNITVYMLNAHTFMYMHPSRGNNALYKIPLLSFIIIKNEYHLFLCPVVKASVVLS